VMIECFTGSVIIGQSLAQARGLLSKHAIKRSRSAAEQSRHRSVWDIVRALGAEHRFGTAETIRRRHGLDRFRPLGRSKPRWPGPSESPHFVRDSCLAPISQRNREDVEIIDLTMERAMNRLTKRVDCIQNYLDPYFPKTYHGVTCEVTSTRARSA